MTSFLKRLFLTAMCFCIASSFAYAEDAPVYDVDTYAPSESPLDPVIAAQQAPLVGGEPEAPSAAVAAPRPVGSEQQRLGNVEQQLANLQQSNLPSRLEMLQNEVQSLRGQVETLTHQLEKMQAEQKNLYMDLDRRMTKEQVISSSPTLAKAVNAVQASIKEVQANKPAPVEKKDAEPNVMEEQQTYQLAYDLIKVKKYNEAINTLQSVLAKYPKGQFAANAHYWLGELYGLLGKNDRSSVEFEAVVKNFRNSPKVSDAQLKLGLIHVNQGKWSEAKTAFKNVINHYPGSPSARLAHEQLKQLKLAGH